MKNYHYWESEPAEGIHQLSPHHLMKVIRLVSGPTSNSHQEYPLIILLFHENSVQTLKLSLAIAESSVGTGKGPLSVFLLVEALICWERGRWGSGKIFWQDLRIGDALGLKLGLLFFDDAVGVFELGFVLVVVTTALNLCFRWDKLCHLFEKVIRAE